MLLPLAERMIEKFIKEDKIEAEAEVSLYLVVLEMQKKYEKALEVLHGKLGKSFWQTLGLHCFVLSSIWSQLAKLYINLIYLSFFRSFFVRFCGREEKESWISCKSWKMEWSKYLLQRYVTKQVFISQVSGIIIQLLENICVIQFLELYRVFTIIYFIYLKFLYSF